MKCEPGPDLIYSPARKAVRYETVLMNNSIYDTSPFKGAPREEQTDAWDEYARWQNLVISGDDLKAINRSSIVLADGSGYLATLDVFHELHCLNIIREYIHRDYYQSRESPHMQFIHADHCLDTLRQIVQCHGDVSIVTFDWVEHQHDPFPNFLVNRECRNWDSILDWAKEHQADHDLIVRPPETPYHHPTQTWKPVSEPTCACIAFE
ncbi:MAG: hypothetical protein MMC33_010358 [Icmadophila ericetorum]|nr:hypothetical protein [Icmadophila ericetorum]